MPDLPPTHEKLWLNRGFNYLLNRSSFTGRNPRSGSSLKPNRPIFERKPRTVKLKKNRKADGCEHVPTVVCFAVIMLHSGRFIYLKKTLQVKARLSKVQRSQSTGSP